MCLQFPENLVNVTWTICCSISTRPLYCLCPRGNMARKIYFSTAVVFFFFSEKKNKWKKKKKVLSRPIPSRPAAPPSPFSHGWSFQTIGCVHRGINGFCEASQPMEGTEPSSEWGTAGLPLLVTAWVFECVFVCVRDGSSWPLHRVTSGVPGPKVGLKSSVPSTVPLLLLNAT